MLWSRYVPGFANRSEPCKLDVSVAYLELPEPLLTLISFLLAEGKLNELFVAFYCGTEWDHVLCHVTEIVTGVFVLARPQTLY